MNRIARVRQSALAAPSRVLLARRRATGRFSHVAPRGSLGAAPFRMRAFDGRAGVARDVASAAPCPRP